MGVAPAASPMPVSEQLRMLELAPIPSFEEHLQRARMPPLTAGRTTVFQVNVGKLCNQRCHHCHVDAGPHQTTANMAWPTFAACLDVVARIHPAIVDITGGAPELNVHFRRFVRELRALGVPTIIDRCNLTVLLLESQRDLADFLAAERVVIVASLPATNASQTDAQRGGGVFERSLAAMRRLNALGYGREGSGLTLTLMSNPVGAFLPPPQSSAEARFHSLLRDRHGVEFTNLIELTNMPISRFLEYLVASGNYQAYLHKLSAAFNPAAVAGLMCLNTLSVGWDGRLYDCDFNQMLELTVAPLQHVGQVPLGVRDGVQSGIQSNVQSNLQPAMQPETKEASRTIFTYRQDLMDGRPVRTGKHCLGCTAGQGSSCGGSTA